MDNFDKALQEDIDERLEALREIERAIFTSQYSISSKHQEIFSTHSISIIYSVWEGFIQKSFNLYIDQLNNINVEFYDFCDSIIIHHMENSFKQFKQYPNPKKYGQKIKFFKDLYTFHSNQYHHISRIVDTESNVSFKVLNHLLKTFSLQPFPEHWRQYRHPNPNLKESMDLFLYLRNTVAHGGDLKSEEKINQDVYSRFKLLVVDLMYEMKLKMLDGLTEETFLRSKYN
ncbi:MAG: hypothetical protein DCF12_14285 [Snowella sp.]|jgi:hypothetical protein|nr:MAG: hypothetical protein DCF12_14285 [Snowella sp.]